MWRFSFAVGGTPRSALVRVARGISARALGRRFAEAATALCVFSLWRRAAPVHRQFLCRHGSGIDTSDDCAEVPGAAATGTHGGGAGVHYAAGRSRNPCHAGSTEARGSALLLFRSADCDYRLTSVSVAVDSLRQGGKLGTRLHHAKNGIARNHADDVRAAVGGVADDGHLVDIGRKEAFEKAEKRLTGRSAKNFLAWDHDGLHGHMRPLIGGD